MNSDNPRGQLAGVLAWAALLCASVTEHDGGREAGQLQTPGE